MIKKFLGLTFEKRLSIFVCVMDQHQTQLVISWVANIVELLAAKKLNMLLRWVEPKTELKPV